MRRLLESSVIGLVLLLENSAISAPLPPDPPEPIAQKEMREQANQLVKEGRLADARDLHLSLWRVNGRSTNAFNVGMLSYRIRDFTTAAEYLTIWLDLVGPLESPKVRVTSAQEHKAMYEQARIDLQGALKQVEAIRVNVSDPGADILVDNRRIGASPLKFPVFVSPGQHRMVAQLGGTQVAEVVSSMAGGERTVRLMLPATPATTTTQARKTRATPLAAARASEPSLWARWLPVGGLAATSVALGIFGGVAVSSANNAADRRTSALHRVRYENESGCPGASACGDFTAADGRVKTMTALSVGAFIGAGLAAAGAGTAVYLLAPKAQVRVGSAPDALFVVFW